MRLIDFDFDLPPEKISRHPAPQRDHSRLLVLRRETKSITHRRFHDLPEFLNPGDTLALNDSRVIPARLFATRENSGGRVELLLLQQREPLVWEVMANPARRMKCGQRFIIQQGQFELDILEELPGGTRLVKFTVAGDFQRNLDHWGQLPLPPYIINARRDYEGLQDRTAAVTAEDRERYQTVFARHDGSVAAPTAGLHFSRKLLESIRNKGVQVVFCTLHIGPGTFLPVQTETVEEHPMHSERFHIDSETWRTIQATRRQGGRIVCVGTTCVRALETQARVPEENRSTAGETDLLILPGFNFQLTDALVTNFHLPRSTLLMLVCAFAGRELTLDAYRQAVERDYRFYSYGDAMLIL